MESKAQISMIGDAKSELMWHEREVGPFSSRAEQEMVKNECLRMQ